MSAEEIKIFCFAPSPRGGRGLDERQWLAYMALSESLSRGSNGPFTGPWRKQWEANVNSSFLWTKGRLKSWEGGPDKIIDADRTR